MISFEHGLILLRYSLTDSAFLSTLLCIQCNCNCYSQNYLLLLVYNNLFFHAQKDF